MSDMNDYTAAPAAPAGTPNAEERQWGMLAHLLAFQLRSEGFYARVARLVAGGTLPRVRIDEVLLLRVSLPPERDRARLCELARLLDATRDESNRLLTQVAELQRSVGPRLLGSGR